MLQLFDIANRALPNSKASAPHPHFVAESAEPHLQDLQLVQSTLLISSILLLLPPPLPSPFLSSSNLPLPLLPTLRDEQLQMPQTVIDALPPPAFNERVRNFAVGLRASARAWLWGRRGEFKGGGLARDPSRGGGGSFSARSLAEGRVVPCVGGVFLLVIFNGRDGRDGRLARLLLERALAFGAAEPRKPHRVDAPAAPHPIGMPPAAH